MKKILSYIIALSMIILVACSGDQKIATATYDAPPLEVNIVFYGSKDHVTNLKFSNKISTKDANEEQTKALIDQIKQINENYKNVESTYEYEIKDDGIVEKINLILKDKNEINKLVQYNMLGYEAKDKDKLDLNFFKEAFEQQGYIFK